MGKQATTIVNKSPIIRVTSAHSIDSSRSGSVGVSNNNNGPCNTDEETAPPSSATNPQQEENETNQTESHQSRNSVKFEQITLKETLEDEAQSGQDNEYSVATRVDVDEEVTHAYTMRWFVLAIFCSHSAINSFQWIQYPIISNIIKNYYDVSSQEVDLTSMIYMITYIPFIINASLMLERVGLRSAICLGAAGTAIGSLVKLQFGSAPGPSSFWAMMVGQTIVALSQLYIISIPPLLAAVWFPDHQVSTATGIGVFGNQLGIALGCIIPPLLISGNKAPKEQLGNELYSLSAGVALISIAVCILAFTCLKDKPPKPPGSASLHAEHRHKERAEASSLSDESNNKPRNKMETFDSIRDLCRDRDFQLLTVSYGINVGVFYALSTVLNQMLSISWPNPDDLSGTMGLLLVVSGMAGSVMCSQLLDRTHAYKLIIVLIYLFSLVSMLLFTLVLRVSTGGPWPHYVASTTLGFFMTGYLPLGFEFAAEITYPHPANTPAGLLNLSAQVFGLLLTYISSVLVDLNSGDLLTNIFLTGCLAIGLIQTVIMKANLRRQQAVAEESLKI